MDRPIPRFTLAFAAGILAGSAFLYAPWTVLAAGGALLALTAIRIRADGARRTAAASLGAGLLSGALFSVLAAVQVPEDHHTRLAPADGRVHEMTGRVASALERDPGRTAFLLELERIDGLRASGLLRVSVRSETIPAARGDRIAVRGTLYPPRGFRNPGGFDYPAHLARQGIQAMVAIRRAPDITVIERGSGALRLVQDLRERIRQSFLRSTSGDGSAVLQAMVLGEEGGLTDDLRDRFMSAGVTHILSISGSHLGLVAVLCFWTGRRLLFLLPDRAYHRLTVLIDPRKLAALGAVIPVIFYALLAGGQVATMRSLIMILAGIAVVMLDREGDLLQALCLAALITLIPAPLALYDISFQLSYLSVLAILYVVHIDGITRPADAPPHARWARRTAMLLAVSLSATLVTGPLAALYFNRISLAGLFANMIVVPYAGVVVVPLGLASGIFSLFTGSLPFAWLNQAATDLFVAMVSFFARLPLASVPVASPGFLFFAGYAGLLAALSIGARRVLLARFQPLEHPGSMPRAVPVAAAVSAALLGLALLLPVLAPGRTRAVFLDAGQGDCALVQTAGGRSVLIDGGGTRDGRFDVGRRVVAPALREFGVGSLDLVVLSHPHPDHMNGLPSIVREFPVREVWWSGRDEDLEGFAELRGVLRELSVPLRAVPAGAQKQDGDLRIEALSPADGAATGRGKAYAGENSRSLVVRITAGARSFLFPGDIHRDIEEQLAAESATLNADVLKVAHHGSRSSSTGRFIRAVAAEHAVISVGAGNRYRHPADDVVQRYLDAGVAVHRTDRDGAVVITDGEGGMTAVRWAEQLPGRIAVCTPGSWWLTERENWKRLWVRAWI